MNIRQIYIFFKISNEQLCWFTHFVRSVNMKLFCMRANQNKNNFRFTTLTKHVNNQTNYRITMEKMKKIWICLVFIYLYINKVRFCWKVFSMFGFVTSNWIFIVLKQRRNSEFKGRFTDLWIRSQKIIFYQSRLNFWIFVNIFILYWSKA